MISIADDVAEWLRRLTRNQFLSGAQVRYVAACCMKSNSVADYHIRVLSSSIIIFLFLVSKDPHSTFRSLIESIFKKKYRFLCIFLTAS